MKKKIFIFMVLITTILCSSSYTFAYVPLYTNTDEIQAYSANMTIVYSDYDTVIPDMYYFDVQFTKPVYSSSYILFGLEYTCIDCNIYASSTYNNIEYMFPYIVSLQVHNWFLTLPYVASNVRHIHFFVDAETGAIAQARLQTLIDDHFYLYYSPGTITVMQDAFIQRYYGSGYNEGEESGYQRGLFEGRGIYNEVYNKGVDDATISFDYRLDEEYSQGYNDGFTQGLSEGDFSWWDIFVYTVTIPFQLMAVELLPGLYVGYFALFTLVMGFLSFLFLFKKGGK